MLEVDASCDEGPTQHPVPFYRSKCAAKVCNYNIRLYNGKTFLKAGWVGSVLDDVMQPADIWDVGLYVLKQVPW